MNKNPDNAYVIGAWFHMGYGFESYEFYIAEIKGDKYRLSQPKWPSTDGDWLTRDQMERFHYCAKFIGFGKPKWYWRFLPWKDLVVPFTQPKP